MIFDGMCYISFASVPLLQAFINKFDGYFFDERGERSGHPLRVVTSDTPLDAGRSNRGRMSGGMRMDEDVYNCPPDSKDNQIYADRYR